MALNLQVEQALNTIAQFLQDQDGNTSPLSISNDMVGIGTADPRTKLHVSGGAITINNPGDGAVLFFLGTERHWQLRQFGSGSHTALELASASPGGNKNFIINTKGHVGIGTTSPAQKLTVEGNILATGDVQLAGADCAEDFDVDTLTWPEAGMVMVIGDEEKLYPCSQPYDPCVAGVLSGAGDCRPGIVLGKQDSKKERLPLALTGKVYCKVDASYAPVFIGDMLTTSPTPGHAMKACDPGLSFGTVIGKALRPLAGGTGLVPILVSLQ